MLLQGKLVGLSSHGVSLATASLPVGEDAYIIPINAALNEMLYLLIDVCLIRLIVENVVKIVDMVLSFILDLNLEGAEHMHHLLSLFECDLALVVCLVVLLQDGPDPHKDSDVALELQILIQKVFLV